MSSFDFQGALLGVSMVALLACGADDFTSSGTASSASSSQSSSGSGGGGGGSGCEAGSVCVPGVPEGWTGPAAVYVGTRPPAACDAPWVTAFTANAGKVTGKVDCEACACGAPTGTVCGAPTATVYAGSACTGAMDTHQLADGACTAFTPGYGANATPSTPGGGSCAPSGGAATKGDPEWDETVLVCAGVPAGGSCSGGACVPSPAAPFDASLCVYRDGDMACPASFTKKTVAYGDLADTRACSTCACDVPAGGSCADAVTIYDDPGCTEASVPPVFVADGTCKNANYVNYLQFDAAAVGGTCTFSGGAPTGDVQPAAPVTICCVGS